jgi:hypothetical protein
MRVVSNGTLCRVGGVKVLWREMFQQELLCYMIRKLIFEALRSKQELGLWR